MVEDILVLSPDLHAPARARAWARTHVVGYSAERVEDALLIISELVTNAVRHARTQIVLSIAIDLDRMRITVSDEVDEPPQINQGSFDGTRPSGRGLVIVAAVATAWGVESAADRRGKTVWADLSLSADHD